MFLSACNGVLIPYSYYNNYTKIINNNMKNNTKLNYNVAYAFEDTMVTNSNIKRNVKQKSYIYHFFYTNNIMCTFTSRLNFHTNELLEIPEKEIMDSIKAGYFDKGKGRGDIQWNYYQIKNNKIYVYDIDYNPSSGANALTKVNIIESCYILYKNGIIYEDSYINCKDTALLKYNLSLPSTINFKPDSSKSNFILSYNKYIATGKRWYYPYYKDFEKYINKK